MIFFFVVGLVFIFLIYYFFLTSKEEYSKNEIGEEIYSWSTSNGMGFITKVFSFLIGLCFLLPNFISIEVAKSVQSGNQVQMIISKINNVELIFRYLSEWTFTDYVFIFIYSMILLFIINIPVYYTFTTRGITYGISGFKRIAFHSWSNIICYDITNDFKPKLQVWFNPPLYKPDWEIEIPKKIKEELNTEMKKHTVHYNVARNKVKK